MAAYRRVYDSRHLQDDCQVPGSAPEPYSRQSSMGYLYLCGLSSRHCVLRLPSVHKTVIVTRFFLLNIASYLVRIERSRRGVRTEEPAQGLSVLDGGTVDGRVKVLEVGLVADVEQAEPEQRAGEDRHDDERQRAPGDAPTVPREDVAEEVLDVLVERAHDVGVTSLAARQVRDQSATRSRTPARKQEPSHVSFTRIYRSPRILFRMLPPHFRIFQQSARVAYFPAYILAFSTTILIMLIFSMFLFESIFNL